MLKTRRWPALAALACAGAILVASAAAATACSLSIMDVTSTSWVGTHGKGYEVFDPQRQSLAVTFRVQGRDGSCPYFVTVAPAFTSDGTTGELQAGASQLRYELHRDASASRPLKPLNLASPSEVFSAATSGNDTAAFQFAILLAPQQVVAPGHYSGDIEITAYEGALGNSILRDRRRVPFQVPVPAVAELSFSQGGGFDPNYGSYSVNFNELERGKRRMVHLKARSNGGYRVSFQSTHGALRHVDPADDSEIPYTMLVDGAAVALPRDTMTPAILRGETTDAAGQRHAIEFVVGEVGNASAGDYRDVISLTVVSLR